MRPQAPSEANPADSFSTSEDSIDLGLAILSALRVPVAQIERWALAKASVKTKQMGIEIIRQLI